MPTDAFKDIEKLEAEVKVFILDKLWQSLPRPPFTDEETEALAEGVYNYVWQRSAGGNAVFDVGTA